MRLDFFLWKREIKACPFSQLRFNPDRSPVKFDDSLNESKSNARSLGTRIEFVKESKYAIAEFGIDSHTIIADEEDRRTVFGVSRLADLDMRVGLMAHDLRVQP